MNKNEDKTKSYQHTVPKFYLRDFADDRGHITVWKREDGTLRRAPIKKTSTSIGFYNVLDSNNVESDEVENSYSAIENKAREIINKMTCIFPDIPGFISDERWIFSFYLALQFVRTKNFRRKEQLLYDYFAKQQIMLTIMSRKEIKNEALIKFLKNPHSIGEIMPSQDKLVRQEIKFAYNFANYFYYRPWEVICLDENSLIVSDNPIFVLPNKEMGEYSNGLLTCQEIWFPLDSKHLLIMGEMSPYPFRKDGFIVFNNSNYGQFVTKKVIKMSNDAQIENSYMEAYGRKELLEEYKNKSLQKKSPMNARGFNDILDSYYNESKMILEPPVGFM